MWSEKKSDAAAAGGPSRLRGSIPYRLRRSGLLYRPIKNRKRIYDVIQKRRDISYPVAFIRIDGSILYYSLFHTKNDNYLTESVVRGARGKNRQGGVHIEQAGVVADMFLAPPSRRFPKQKKRGRAKRGAITNRERPFLSLPFFFYVMRVVFCVVVYVDLESFRFFLEQRETYIYSIHASYEQKSGVEEMYWKIALEQVLYAYST